jgi:hypothetical protein
MKIFGLTTTQHWTSWLLTAMGMNCVYTSLTVLICKMCNMFPSCNFVVIGIIHYFYLLSLLTGGMLISVFFEKQQTASTVGLVLNVALYSMGWLLSALRGRAEWMKALVSPELQCFDISSDGNPFDNCIFHCHRRNPTRAAHEANYAGKRV